MKTPRIKNLSLQEYLNYAMENAKKTPHEDQITEGTASMQEVLEDLIDEVEYPSFNNRLGRYLQRNHRVIKPFESGIHRQLFESQITDKNCSDSNYMAAIYLLTSEENTWRSVREYVSKQGIKYDLVDPIPSDDGYTLFQLAKDITQGTKHATLADIVSSTTIKPQMFLVICKAIAISRYGVGAVGIKPRDPREEVVIFKLVK